MYKFANLTNRTEQKETSQAPPASCCALTPFTVNPPLHLHHLAAAPSLDSNRPVFPSSLCVCPQPPVREGPVTRSASRAASLHSLSDASSDSFNHSPGEPTKDATREHFSFRAAQKAALFSGVRSAAPPSFSGLLFFIFLLLLFSASRMAERTVMDVFFTDTSYLCGAKRRLATLELLSVVQN